MNKQQDTNAPRRSGTEAGGQHEGLRHPIDDDKRTQQRLDDVGLDDQGDVAEDQLRDRRSSGAPRDGGNAKAS